MRRSGVQFSFWALVRSRLRRHRGGPGFRVRLADGYDCRRHTAGGISPATTPTERRRSRCRVDFDRDGLVFATRPMVRPCRRDRPTAKPAWTYRDRRAALFRSAVIGPEVDVIESLCSGRPEPVGEPSRALHASRLAVVANQDATRRVGRRFGITVRQADMTGLSM